MKTMLVNSEWLNVRKGPGTEHAVIATVPKGFQLRCSAQVKGWTFVRPEGGRWVGWASARYLVDDEAPWMRIARLELGVSEITGKMNEKRIIGYHATTTLKATSDEVSWCSSFVNWVMQTTGRGGTGSAAARSWLHYGSPLKEFRYGCIVVLSRGANPQSGHVGFGMMEEGKNVRLLGGNQGNQVCVAPFPRSRVLGYRWPVARGEGSFDGMPGLLQDD